MRVGEAILWIDATITGAAIAWVLTVIYSPTPDWKLCRLLYWTIGLGILVFIVDWDVTSAKDMVFRVIFTAVVCAVSGTFLAEAIRYTYRAETGPKIDNREQQQTVLSPAQERLLVLLAKYERQFATNKLVISREDGGLVFDGAPRRGQGVSLINDLFGATDEAAKVRFVDLVESMPAEYVKFIPEMRWDSPFVISVTPGALQYLRAANLDDGRDIVVGTPQPISAPQPLLRLAPAIVDQQIRWPDKSINPNGDPFQLKLRNIGDGRAIDIQLTFTATLDGSEVKSELAKSELFVGYSVKEKTVLLPLSKGTSWSSTEVLIVDDGVRRKDVLETSGDGQFWVVDYPNALKSMLSVWVMCKSYEAEAYDRTHTPKFGELESVIAASHAGDNSKLRQWTVERQKRNTIRLPDITVTAKYYDLARKVHTTSFIIRSMINMLSNAMWVIEAPNSANSYLKGPAGMLSYEDQDNPTDGYFNVAKREGLF